MIEFPGFKPLLPEDTNQPNLEIDIFDEHYEDGMTEEEIKILIEQRITGQNKRLAERIIKKIHPLDSVDRDGLAMYINNHPEIADEIIKKRAEFN